MRTFASLAASLAIAAPAAPALACDVGSFPDMPGEPSADVIAIGRVGAVTQSWGAASVGTASAEITIERVVAGDDPGPAYRLQWTVSRPGDCWYAEGPNLRQGDRVALYLVRAGGQLRAADWFMEKDAERLDPRILAPAEASKPRPGEGGTQR
jgi:hypothetical protein